ncbi:DUF3048 domain-containing protein [Streptomyces sp. DSM 41886]|uniref:DUF3048 domain-containing protein n=2 Tax=Streptomyces johnsoniae TaxID=3075532 RepID=A0ABU2SD22_9ACTN|nr:DUF3048 domain-containing protein [Streptomyces sp. DSM 41886]MDT0446848.1 DUF3048 domain-containing protein [Streptomyces sp. DSM 41886]
MSRTVPREARGRRRTRALAACALLAALAAAGAAGCQVEDEGEGEDGGERSSPFTGRPAERGAPVLAVKIDNAPQARPHTGLGEADLVYVEQVEAGLSRLVAVYASRLPDRVGPVRSARESDLELLRQFGEPALAYSGVQSRLRETVDDAPLFPVSPDAAPDAYRRDEARAAPHNLYVRPAAVLDAAPGASTADDIGFTFGAPPEEGGEEAASHRVAYPNAAFDFTWSADRETWEVAMDGTPAPGVAPATVVVQEVTVRESEYHDYLGNFTPYTETVGSGEAVVLRDGRAFAAEWERPSERSGTEFTTPDGSPLNFAPGQVWVVYAQA